MTAERWCAASIWSNGTRSRARSRRAASSPRRPPCICPISRLPIPRTASRRASASNSWVRATIDARCGWPSVRELRSMADTETKAKAEKPQTADRAARPEKGDKAQQAQKGPKPERGHRAGKGKPPAGPPRRRGGRVTPRLKTYFEDVVRKKLSEEFGYKNRLQVPVIEKVVINMGIGEGVND